MQGQHEFAPGVAAGLTPSVAAQPAVVQPEQIPTHTPATALQASVCSLHHRRLGTLPYIPHSPPRERTCQKSMRVGRSTYPPQCGGRGTGTEGSEYLAISSAALRVRQADMQMHSQSDRQAVGRHMHSLLGVCVASGSGRSGTHNGMTEKHYKEEEL